MSDNLDTMQMGAIEKEGELRSPVDLVSDMFKDFIDNIGPYALAGVGLMLVIIGAVIGMYVLMAACMGGAMVGMFASIAALGEDAGAMIGMVLVMGAYLGVFVLILAMNLVLTPMTSSLYRAVDAHMAGEEGAMGFGSMFSTMRKQPMKDIIASVVVGFLVILGLPLLYIGAFVIAFFIGFAPLMVILDGEPIGSALAKSFNHTKKNIGWHLGTFGLMVVIGIVAGNIPVLGPMAAIAFVVRSYREAFPRPESLEVTV